MGGDEGSIPSSDIRGGTVEAHKKLRAVRTAAKIPQRVVAAALGLPRSAVSKIESGLQPLSADHIPAAAAALGVSSGELVEDVSEYLERTAPAGSKREYPEGMAPCNACGNIGPEGEEHRGCSAVEYSAAPEGACGVL
tara:strand:- start:80 stop:493 length:414 start_codon:yes stop_codon:yes gene_type:complete